MSRSTRTSRKYSEAPWHIKGRCYIDDDLGNRIATLDGAAVMGRNGRPQRFNLKADLLLIKNAPDLLRSLKECLARLESLTPGLVLDEKDWARVVIKRTQPKR